MLNLAKGQLIKYSDVNMTPTNANLPMVLVKKLVTVLTGIKWMKRKLSVQTLWVSLEMCACAGQKEPPKSFLI